MNPSYCHGWCLQNKDDRMVQDDLKSILFRSLCSAVSNLLFLVIISLQPFILLPVMIQLHHMSSLTAQGAISYGALAKVNV